ncbi:MAG: aminoacyl-tRNA hydrolase, partial [Finegoldia magna]|nr:aminoacyl-tRNA hydrolase [Finegoldia magna]
AILDCFNYYNLSAENLIVICDDIDIPFGTIRIKKKGSAGTHNGLKSIIYLIQSQDFARIKVSVGQNDNNYDLKDFVLSQFSKKEFEVLKKEIDMSSEACIKIVEENVDYAMNNFNGKSLI